MEQYDVCAPRSNMLDQAVTLNRSHGKLKRDQSDFIDDAFKPNSIKVPRHSQLSSVDSSCPPRELPPVSSVAVARSTGELTAASLNINTMSVLPRLLRTMTNGSNGGGQPVLACHNNYILSSSAGKACPSASSFGPSTDNTDVNLSSASVCLTSAAAASTSPSSSMTPTSNSNSSNFISFLSPVAAMAAAALSSSNSNSLSTNGDQRQSGMTSGLDSGQQMQSVGGTSSCNASQETSGLVTLATASSLIERQWLTRNTGPAAASLTMASGGGGLSSSSRAGLLEPGEARGHLQLDEQQQQVYTHGVGETVVGNSRSLVGKLPSGQSVNGGATPATHAVLDVHSLAALICETQKQCTGSRALLPGCPTTAASSTATATTNLTDSCTNVRMVVATSATPPDSSQPRDRYHHLDGITGQLQQQQGDSQAVLLESSSEAVQAVDHSILASGKAVAPAATAYISLQPAPGSLLASSNFQQLMASGEFMSPTARQTLLGQTSDGSSRQLYLLVPTDCPVIMSRPSNAKQQQQQPPQTSSVTAVDDSLSAGSPPPPILESLTTSTNQASRSRAPILEAISPDVVSVGVPEDEPDVVACAAAIGQQFSTAGSLSQLTTAGGSPNTLSTLIAGLGSNQQHHLQQQVSPIAVAASAPSTSASVSWASADASLRLPGISVVSVSTAAAAGGGPGFVHGVTGEQARFGGGEAVAAGDVNALLGAVKSDPDMYTPNGHLYAGPDEIGRFRCYPTTAAAAVYSHPTTSCTTNGATGTGSHSQSSPAGLLLRCNNNNAGSPSNASAGVANFFHLAASSSSTSIASLTGAAAAVAVGHDLHHLQHQQHPSVLLSQQTSSGLSASPTGGVATASHLLQHQHHLSSGGIAPSSAVRSSTTSASLSQVVASMSTKPSVLQPLVIEDPQQQQQQQQRHSSASILTPTSVNRIDSTTTAYLEHINSDSKDIRRRVSHNEVERRRRDRINTWISELYKLLPPDEQAKSQYQSKGMVLKRVFEYFQNVDSMLSAANTAVEQTRIENGVLRQRVRDLQSENQLLSASLQLGAAAAAVQLKQRQPSSLKSGNGSKSCGDDESGEPASGSSSAMTNGELLPSISVVGHLRHSTAGASGVVHRGDQLVAADYQTLPQTATGSCNGSAVTNGGAGAGTVTLFTMGGGGLVGNEYTLGESSCDPSRAGGHSSPVAISSSVLPTAVNTTGILTSASAGGGSLGLSRPPMISLPSLELVAGAVSTLAGNADGQLAAD